MEIRTLPELVETRADDLGEETYVIEAETGEQISYEELNTRADSIGSYLRSEGIEKGAKVGVILPNSIDLVAAITGILKAGAIVVPINYEYTRGEISYILDQSDSEAVITAAEYERKVREGSEGTDTSNIIDIEDVESRAVAEPLPEVDPVDTALILFTSGTTGDPKGVEHSHLNLLLRFEGGEMLRGFDVFYTLLPLYNIDGFTSTFGTLYDSGQVLLRDGFSASSFWSDVEAYGAKITSVVPSILAILLERGAPANTDISSFEVFMVSGSYVHEELVEAFEAAFEIEVMEIYGLTEAAGTTYEDPTDMVPGSAGASVEFSELSVVDKASREELPPREIGEIRIRGPTVFKQYYKNSEATHEVFESNWFKTGDLGYVDEDGRYYILDRIKNIIIRGGQNIYPGEIEETIHKLDEIEDVAVVGEDHDIYGEVPVAYITTGSKTSRRTAAEEVRKICQENLADFKQPEEIRHIDEFPRGETGKILKTEL